MQIAEGYSALHSSIQSQMHVYSNNRTADRVEEIAECFLGALFIEAHCGTKEGNHILTSVLALISLAFIKHLRLLL